MPPGQSWEVPIKGRPPGGRHPCCMNTETHVLRWRPDAPLRDGRGHATPPTRPRRSSMRRSANVTIARKSGAVRVPGIRRPSRCMCISRFASHRASIARATRSSRANWIWSSPIRRACSVKYACVRHVLMATGPFEQDALRRGHPDVPVRPAAHGTHRSHRSALPAQQRGSRVTSSDRDRSARGKCVCAATAGPPLASTG